MKTLIKKSNNNINNNQMEKFVYRIKSESDAEYVSWFVSDDSQ